MIPRRSFLNLPFAARPRSLSNFDAMNQRVSVFDNESRFLFMFLFMFLFCFFVFNHPFVMSLVCHLNVKIDFHIKHRQSQMKNKLDVSTMR